jgi:nucleotidyltransferase/DNA polymerase involved in DNA repair
VTEEGYFGDLTDYGNRIRSTVKQWTGIPVSILRRRRYANGIAPTKVLAKVAILILRGYANEVAKKSSSGVFHLETADRADEYLAIMPVREIWGIGSRLGQWLTTQGIATALEFKQARPELVLKKMGVVGKRLLLELHGFSCLPIETVPSPKQETCVTRSFGEPVTTLVELQQALALYVCRAAEKLRRQGQVAMGMTIFARTSRFIDSFAFWLENCQVADGYQLHPGTTKIRALRSRSNLCARLLPVQESRGGDDRVALRADPPGESIGSTRYDPSDPTCRFRARTAGMRGGR